MKLILVGLSLLVCPVNALAQHDPGRNAVRQLADKQFEKAVQTAGLPGRQQNSPSSEEERVFISAMAAAKKGDLDAAFAFAKQAVSLGLPIERFQAGPREVFQSMYALPEFSKWLQAGCDPLIHGPLLGSVTDVSARFWVRTAKEADIQVDVVSKRDLPSPQKRYVGLSRTFAEDDYTAVVTIDGLQPSNEYTYVVLVDGKDTTRGAEFNTLPAESSASQFSIAFGGGAGYTPDYERMWSTIKGHNVDSLLLLGDNVYIDDPKNAMTQHYCYYRRQSQPDWRQLVASTSVHAIYDDHDFAVDDSVPGPQIEKPPWKRDVWKVFTQNWNNRQYGGGAKQPGCWHDFTIGDVHFIMLDCRYYRDLKGGSMLGPVQEKWALDTLAASTATFKVLVSSVPWAPGVKPGSKDTWDGFATEREQFFSFIERQHINGVVLMSADRHRTDMRKIVRPNGYDLYEVMSSRLTNVHTHELMENAQGSEFIMGYNTKCSFGLLEFDTTLQDPQVKFSMINIDDELIDSRTLKASELIAPTADR